MSVWSGSDGLSVVEAVLGLRVQACKPPHVPVPVPGPCKGWRKKIKTIKPRARAKARVGDSLFGGNVNDPITSEQKDEIDKIYGGTFGDLTTRTTEIKREQKDGITRIVAEGKIYGPDQDPDDEDEEEIGNFARELFEREGQRWIRHEELTLDPDFQGQGFATAFNAQAMDWYREHDVAGVELHADIDIGGIAWARAGYDWKSSRDAKAIADRILLTLTEMADRIASEGDDARRWWRMPSRRRSEQARLAIEMRRRMISSTFGEDDFPTPYELSELGRWPGARFTGDDWDDDGDWWIGRVIMTGSDWEGVTLP